MIRKATVSDLDSILGLLQEVLTVHHDIRSDIFKEKGSKYTNEELISILENPDSLVFVYEEEGIVLGHLFCCEKITEEKNNSFKRRELYIDDLCITKNARNKGIGHKLYEYIKDYAINNNFDYITLNVWEGNTAKTFYTSLGLKPRCILMEEKLK